VLLLAHHAVSTDATWYRVTKSRPSRKCTLQPLASQWHAEQKRRNRCAPSGSGLTTRTVGNTADTWSPRHPYGHADCIVEKRRKNKEERKKKSAVADAWKTIVNRPNRSKVEHSKKSKNCKSKQLCTHKFTPKTNSNAYVNEARTKCKLETAIEWSQPTIQTPILYMISTPISETISTVQITI